ncbi:hypothetical protein H8F24_13620 [Synechococcus sp. CBW1002]|uniref:hypothetical protein n=1 Tax=Synechococcus sp. CBW1002 TaxID=1353134 RepID=UPI0018CF6AF6|nr:hypothetical protein [Synechococcus sp. CBW1002]QPN59114.1 hypothetical protein H8F24_13620 [Synechococcus sp. CBW1002]
MGALQGAQAENNHQETRLLGSVHLAADERKMSMYGKGGETYYRFFSLDALSLLQCKNGLAHVIYTQRCGEANLLGAVSYLAVLVRRHDAPTPIA